MELKNLTLINYKNIENLNLTFSSKINCFIGENGAGKTNILDAIYYSSMCRSSISMSDNQIVNHNSNFFMIEAQYETGYDSIDTIVCSYKNGGVKKVKRNDKEYDKLSTHIGVVPIILISPYDTTLISDAADERRKFVDQFISQLTPLYIKLLIKHRDILLHRNNLLKKIKDNNESMEILELIDMQLVDVGSKINEYRRNFISELLPILSVNYSLISENREEINLIYQSQLEKGDYSKMLADSLQRDLFLGYTTIGIHRDDIKMTIADHPIKKYGSQGQQKTFLISLKLSLSSIVLKHRNVVPILLLDDIFDKLDQSRVMSLLNLFSTSDYGQIFLSDSNKNRVSELLKNLTDSYSVFNISGGNAVCCE